MGRAPAMWPQRWKREIMLFEEAMQDWAAFGVEVERRKVEVALDTP